MLKTLAGGFAILLVLVAAAYVALALSFQRKALFPSPPASLTSPAASRPDVEVLHLDGVETWLLSPLPTRGGPAPAVIFTHGNGELIDHWLDALEPLSALGLAVLLVEYPGYGRSAGSPSERSITRTMLAAYDTLRERPEIDPERIIAYGRSLGGGAACALARHRPLAALVLESSFTSVRRFARSFGLIGPLVLDPFENLQAVRAFDGPVLIIHGRDDRIIPVEHAHDLTKAARAAELHLLECGHNDCPRPWPQIRQFLERHGLIDR